MKNYYSYVYLDSTVIDDLYPQVFGDDTIGIEVLKTREEVINADINANFLSVLGSKLDSSKNTISSENTKIVTSTARKAQLLINHFKTDEISIEKIIEQNRPLNESVYFVGQSKFFLRDILDKSTGRSLFVNVMPHRASFTSEDFTDENVVLNNDAVFVLETGDDEYVQRYRNGYYRDYSPGILEIMMHVSNIKIRKDVRHLTSVIRKRASFNFFVFGELIHTNSNFYKISPFAIWL